MRTFYWQLLNSTPVVDGVPTDDLADLEACSGWLVEAGGIGTAAELPHLHRARAALQAIVRGDLAASGARPARTGGQLRTAGRGRDHLGAQRHA